MDCCYVPYAEKQIRTLILVAYATRNAEVAKAGRALDADRGNT